MLKVALAFALVVYAIGHSVALAQVGTERQVEWRLTGARHAIPSGPGRLKEVEGVLISDTVRGEIRFETSEQVGFVVPYDRIDALHYEESKYPQRFLRRSSFYLTLHYTDADRGAAFATIRVLSERDALTALATLEEETGHTFERALSTQSFLGIPIRAGIGARVAVTDQAGETTKGVITQLSASSLTLDESTSVARVFDETSLQRIRLLYSPKHDALVGLAAGAAVGVSGVYLSAGLSGCFSPDRTTDCHVLRTAAVVAGISGGLGALIGMTVGSLRYPFNNAFDVYRGDQRGASSTVAVTIAPLVGDARKGALVTVRF